MLKKSCIIFKIYFYFCVCNYKYLYSFKCLTIFESVFK